MSNPNHLVTVAVFDQPLEAHAARLHLKEEGIECFLADEYIVSQLWIYNTAVGGIKLQVPESEARRAILVLRRDPAAAAIESGEAPLPIIEHSCCPACGSGRVTYEKYSARAFFVSLLFLGFPIPVSRNKWKCGACGHEFRREGTPTPPPGSVPNLPPEVPETSTASPAPPAPKEQPVAGGPADGIPLFRILLLMIPAAVVAYLIEYVACATPTVFRLTPLGRGGLQGFYNVIVFIGPAVEEALKITPLAWIVWKSPARVRSAASLLTATILCGGAFGALENLAILNVHFPDIPPALLSALTRWRWSVCLPLHAVCSLIAGVGLVSAWRLGRKGQPGKGWSRALFFYLHAVAVHAIYNLSTIFHGIL